jgi:type I restriction-modification system DNA methylase subunit
MPKPKATHQKQNGSALGFEARPWAAAVQMRGHIDALKYKDESQRAEAAENRDFFSLSASNGERAGVRCRIRSSPVNNANYAWIQHFIHQLSPMGVAGFVMANNACTRHSFGMKTPKVVRKHAAEHGVSEEDVLKKGVK